MIVDPHTHDTMIRYKKHLESVVNSVDRSLDHLVPSRNGEELHWVIATQIAMHQETNRLRDIEGLPPVSLQAIEEIERMAIGHSDYGSKFAWYCAELAVGARDIRP